VRGLTAADFRIEERGRAQEIAQLGDPEEVPLDIALLIDISGSVNERFSFELEAAGRFLRQVLRAPDRATIFTIGDGARRIGERATVDTAVRNLSQVQPTRGITAFYDTVAAASDYLARTSPPRTRRVVICISDGDDRFSDKFTTSAMTIPELQRAEVTFYAINPGGNSLRLNVLAVRGQAEMVKLSGATGGTVFVPEVIEDLDKVFRQITAELRSQYLIQYYSNNEAAPGTFLPIQVRTTKRPELRVRARQGYFAGTVTGGGATVPNK
jgi:Ca-activated chloride channel family protein